MFSKIIKKVRLEHKETQQLMAEKLGVSQRTIASWESGDRLPTFEMLLQISDCYEISTDYLLGRSKHHDFYRHNITLPSGQQITILSSEREEPTSDEKEQIQQAMQNALQSEHSTLTGFPVDPNQRQAFDAYIRQVVRAELDERD